MNVTACQMANISWVFSGPENFTISMTVTNGGVMQQAGSPGAANTSLVAVLINSSVPVSAGKFSWQVDVQPGHYSIVASNAALLNSSPVSASSAFLGLTTITVNPSTNESCLDTRSSSASATQSSTPSPNSASASSGSSSAGPKGLSGGAIAGTVAGVIVGVVALVGAFTIPRWWRNRVQRLGPRTDGRPYYLF